MGHGLHGQRDFDRGRRGAMQGPVQQLAGGDSAGGLPAGHQHSAHQSAHRHVQVKSKGRRDGRFLLFLTILSNVFCSAVRSFLLPVNQLHLQQGAGEQRHPLEVPALQPDRAVPLPSLPGPSLHHPLSPQPLHQEAHSQGSLDQDPPLWSVFEWDTLII